MGGIACLCNGLSKRLKPVEKPREAAASCECGWEVETGHAIAVGLGILEGKRLFLLAVGIFAEWNVIRFAGGLVPLILTVVSACLGGPAAFATVFAIQKRRRDPRYRCLKGLLKCLSIAVLFCALMNAAVIATFGAYLNIRREDIAGVFNASMMLYAEESSHKTTIDQLQFTLQCCGHAGYSDWIAFDWQKADYASRDEMSSQRRISDEDLRSMAVPFSCCRLRSMRPCFHMDFTMNADTINDKGCAEVLSRLVFRSAALAYCISAFLVLTQILLAILVLKIAKRPFRSDCPSLCECTEKCPSVCPLLDHQSSTSYVSSTGNTSPCSDRANSSAAKNRRRNGKLSTISSRTSGSCSSSSPTPPPSSGKSKTSSAKKTSARTRCNGGCGAARIRPSLHTEHRVPKKRCSQKRTVRPS
ncbi:uncharacterized protein LOC124304969 isoform X1 [Neodiprion virginianus]|uniref:uncharacterized protein LOC124304969 isoform X1 n=1 Tax=Neodiprion virginianus TaxID=2961670 RepID=UPI001EE76F15|nr:uncharacterized protein LOC124304969 isoform X1 [Neodiprion virginianus]